MLTRSPNYNRSILGLASILIYGHGSVEWAFPGSCLSMDKGMSAIMKCSLPQCAAYIVDQVLDNLQWMLECEEWQRNATCEDKLLLRTMTKRSKSAPRGKVRELPTYSNLSIRSTNHETPTSPNPPTG